jgi:hypothetical protein
MPCALRPGPKPYSWKRLSRGRPSSSVSQCRHTWSLRFLDFDGAVRLRHGRGKQARRGAARETQTRAFAPVCFRRVEVMGTACFGLTSEYLRYLALSYASKGISVRVLAVERPYFAKPNITQMSRSSHLQPVPGFPTSPLWLRFLRLTSAPLQPI